MENNSESEKLGVIIFGQQFCSKLEHIPIKKRILLRDSALYQRTPSSAEELDQKISPSPLAQKSDLPGFPFVAQQSDPIFFSKRQPANLKCLQSNDKSRQTVVLNNDDADSHHLYSAFQTPTEFTVDRAEKDPGIYVLSPCTRSELSAVSSVAPVAKSKDLDPKPSKAVQGLTSIVTMEPYSDDKSTFQPDHVSSKDLETEQPITEDSRSMWDLNVEMDAWEKPNCHLHVESKSYSNPTTADVQFVTDLERSEELRLKGELLISENDAGNNGDDKNIIVEGESSVNILPASDDEDNGLSKKGTDFKADQLDANVNTSADQLENGVYVEEGDLFATPGEKIIVETVKKAAPSLHALEEVTENSLKHVGSMGNSLVSSFQEGRDVSIVQSLDTPANCNQGASVIKQVPSINNDCWAQTEQDYEDGELRDMDIHYWNEDETKMGEIECLDYEPDIEDIDELDESQTSGSAVGRGESGLKNKKCDFSETLVNDHLVRMDDVSLGLFATGHGPRVVNAQLEKKLSGWDQLPKDGCASSEKAQEKHGILSRTRRSELQICGDVPTLSEDAEDKETVVERRIRPKDMLVSYPSESGSGIDKFSGKRSTPHMHRRNRDEDWDSERRSSVNYHDLYDNHPGSRHVYINSKGRERCRSRSPYSRNEVYGPHISFSRYSGGRQGNRAESGRSLRGARNGYRGSLAYDRSESEFCTRQQILRRDRSFSPRATAHFSETFNRSRSRSRTRSPSSWVPTYDRLGPRVHHRSPEFSADDRVKRTRLPYWKANFPPDSGMRYTSPPRSGFIPHNKPRWNDEEDFNLRGSRDRSPVRSFRQKEKFDASSSRGRFKSREDFRPIEYRGRLRENSPSDRLRSYISSKDREKREDSIETGQRRRYYKDGFMRRNNSEDDIAIQNFPVKEDFLEDGETRSVSMRKKDSRSHERF